MQLPCGSPGSGSGSGSRSRSRSRGGQHRFHRSCIVRWLGDPLTPTCPQCRQRFNIVVDPQRPFRGPPSPHFGDPAAPVPGPFDGVAPSRPEPHRFGGWNAFADPPRGGRPPDSARSPLDPRRGDQQTADEERQQRLWAQALRHVGLPGALGPQPARPGLNALGEWRRETIARDVERVRREIGQLRLEAGQDEARREQQARCKVDSLTAWSQALRLRGRAVEAADSYGSRARGARGPQRRLREARRELARVRARHERRAADRAFEEAQSRTQLLRCGGDPDPRV